MKESTLPYIVFAKQPSNSLLCPICQEVFRDAHHVVPCCHTFCKSCISSWLPLNKSCPTCRKAAQPNAIAVAHVVKDIVGDLLVCCPRGISVPSSSSSSSHEIKSGVIGVDWKTRPGACQVRLPLRDMASHWKTCGVEKVQDTGLIYCPYKCGKKISVTFDKPSDYLERHLRHECSKSPLMESVQCPHKSCGATGTRGIMHLAAAHDDAEPMPPCPFCNDEDFDDMEEHIRESHPECFEVYEANQRPNRPGCLSVAEIVRTAAVIMLKDFEPDFSTQTRNRIFNSIKVTDLDSLTSYERTDFGHAIEVINWPSEFMTPAQTNHLDAILDRIRNDFDE